MTRRFVARAAVVAALVSLAEARAQTGDKGSSELTIEQRATAARLADEGMALFDKEDFTGAVDRFEKAGEIVRIPTILLQHGRALERLGRWVQAVEKFREVAAAPITATTPWQHRSAKVEGEKELARLEPKIPRLRFLIGPPSPDPTEITIDGRGIGAVGTSSVPVDPGDHVVEAKRPDGTFARVTVTAKPEAVALVELELERPAPTSQATPEDRGMHPIELAGWIAIGVGGASALLGTATGIAAITLAEDLDERCPDRRCAPPVHEDVGTYDALRWTSGVTLFAGIAIAGGGVAAVLLSPEPARDVVFRPWVGPNVAGVEVVLP
jgi:hypothetical protein